jgi:hypothetical protein
VPRSVAVLWNAFSVLLSFWGEEKFLILFVLSFVHDCVLGEIDGGGGSGG